MSVVRVNSSVKEAQNFVRSSWHWVSQNFPFFGVSPILLILIAVVGVMLLIAWNLVGKGKGSHAGREEIRRQYRRSLAREMAKQDAAKILAGEKRRRWWYKW